jgi:hypothetical protein
MKKRLRDERNDDLRPEYPLKQLLKAGVKGKYVTPFRRGTNLILLEPEISMAFPNAQAVNEALRMVLELGKFSNGRKKQTVAN